MIKKLIMIRK